ncbi:MAG TPA: hypothetical protein VGI81_00025 [Tepidisphaeraceae bacterium]|jgi:hypothetical protein
MPAGLHSRERWHVAAAFALGFLAFLPYPAIPAGNNSAIQFGTLLTLLLLVPVALTPWKGKPFYVALVLLVPLAVSAAKVAVTGQAGLDVSLKTLLMWALPLLTLLPAQLYAPRYLMPILTGIALAALLHVAVGCWQEYVFLNGGELPLLSLYVNPSFLSVEMQARDMVRYEQRPFGLFPEPSAMSSSLAPWVLLWTAELCGLIRFPARPARWQRWLFTTATVGSLLLIISSRSGHAMITLAVVVLFGALWLKKARATPRNFLATLAVFGVVLPLAIGLTVLALGDRVAGATGTNESWVDRSYSLVVGLRMWLGTDLPTVIFGMGIGQSGPAISARAGLEAVWSVLLGYLYESGVIGGIALAWVGASVWRAWRASRMSLVFAAIFVVWLVGVTVTTSYNQLLPIWLALGLFTVWPAVFPAVDAGQPRARATPPADESAPSSPNSGPDRRDGVNGLTLTPWGRGLR